TATGDSNSTQPSSGTTATTAQANELLIGVVGHDDGRATFDADSNFISLTPINANGQSGLYVFPEYRFVSATGGYAATATNTNGKPAKWAAAIVTYKLALPTVSSIVRANANPTGNAAVNFTVTFNQSVFGVDASDFALATSGG